MSPEIHLQTVAQFGKRDGASDYRWLFGRDVVPSVLLTVCEMLAQLAAVSTASLSVVTEEQDMVWLARTYFQSSDNAYRPVPAVEVAYTSASTCLSTEDWLGLAALSLQQPQRERLAEPGGFSIQLSAP
jgi:hypothetical protein